MHHEYDLCGKANDSDVSQRTSQLNVKQQHNIS